MSPLYKTVIPSLLLAFASTGCAAGASTDAPSSSEPSAERKQAFSTGITVNTSNDNAAGTFDFLVEVNGHIKGQPADVMGACTGNLISNRVVVTAKHCLTAFDQIKVTPTYATNKTPIAVTTYFGHASPRIDVGIIILPAPVSVRKVVGVMTTAQLEGGFAQARLTGERYRLYTIGRVLNNTLLTNDFAYGNDSWWNFPTGFWNMAPTPGTLDEYVVRGAKDPEHGDSGGPCYDIDFSGPNYNIALSGITVARVHFANDPPWLEGINQLCVRTDIIRDWLMQAVATNAVVTSSATAFTQYPDYKNSSYIDVWEDIYRNVQRLGSLH